MSDQTDIRNGPQKGASMKTIPILIPDEIADGYGNIDELKKIIIENFVASEYEKGSISIRQGARILGLTYEEFMIDFLGKRKMPFINRSEKELESESEREEKWLDEILENSRQ
jgi:predicted HTH domain antitoxin